MHRTDQNAAITLYLVPALRYAREWWIATHHSFVFGWDVLAHPELVEVFRSEANYMVQREYVERADIVSRPVLAATVALARVGWTPLSANRFRDRRGHEISLLDIGEASPKARMLADATQQAAHEHFPATAKTAF